MDAARDFEVVIRQGGQEDVLDLGRLFDGCIAYRPERDADDRIVEFRCIFIDTKGLLFLPAEEQLGRGLAEVFPWVRDNGAFARNVEVMRTGVAAKYQLITDQYDRPYVLDMAANRAGDVLLVTYVDATARGRAQSEAEDRTAEYRSLAEALPDAIIRLDADFVVTYVNAAGRSFTEPTGRPEPVGRPALEAVAELVGDPQRVEQFGQRLQRVRDSRTGEALQFEVLGRLFDIRLIPEVDHHGVIRSVLLIGRDITVDREAEKQRLAVEGRLEQADRLDSLGVLAGGIAHDFNNLLVGMLGNAELASAALPDDSPALPLLAGIVNAAQRAAELTRQLLVYAGRQTGETQLLDLDTIVEETVALIQSTIAPARLELELDGALPAVQGEPSQIRQVVMNLLINAADALGGRRESVTLRTSKCSLSEAEAREWSPVDPLTVGDYVRIDVSDRGHGMEAATAARVFEPFFSTREHGRGLGLAVVHGIVRSHGGAIRVDSAPGVGTTMSVVLPIASGANPSTTVDAQVPEPVADPESAGRRVLVVDDDDSVRQVTTLVLRRAGLEVIGAESGPEALRLFERESDSFGAVLLDLTMPGMGGDEVLPALRAIDPAIPVVLISGYSTVEIEGRVHHLGVDGFIQKPFRPSELVAAVMAVLRPTRRSS